MEAVPSSSNRTFLIVLAVVVALFVGILLRPQIAAELAPRLEAVYVAIEPAGSGLATVGRVELEEGTAFTLRAVVQARRRGGEPLYYTDARRLRLGAEEIPADQLTPWNRSDLVKLRYFTVEGKAPYIQLAADSGIQGFRMEEFARGDWPMAWSIPGELDPAFDHHLAASERSPRPPFGTQRYHLRFETYAQEKDLVPSSTLRSWGVAELKREIARFPTVVVKASGPLAAVSRCFGLSQLDSPPSAGAELEQQIDELSRHGIAFSRLTLLRDLTAARGKVWQDLSWQPLALDGSARWRQQGANPEGVGPGDLLRVGDRVVVLYRDAGAEGRLDRDDLAFDFVRGARMAPLSAIFSGDGEIEHTALGAP